MGTIYCRASAVVGVVMIGLASSVAAQAPVVQAATLEVGEWSMTPIRAITGGSVTGILAIKDADAVVGDNLSVVAYRRAADGSWSSWTWTEGPSAAIAWLAATGESAAVHEMDGAPSISSVPAQAPVVIISGVLEGDPASEAVADPVIGPSVLSMLASIGYPAADVPVSGSHELPQVGPCSQNAILEAASLAFQSNSAVAVAAMSASLAANCELCFYWTFTTVFPWSEWTCGAWSLRSGPRVRTVCIDQCEYQRQLTRSRTRDIWTLHWDCSTSLVTQTQIESGWQLGTCDLPLAEVNCVSGALPCPATPACDLSAHLCAAGPDTGTSKTGWN